MRDNRAVHAVARLLLHGRIDHVQCSWVKLGPEQCAQVLAGGVDDLGGTLMEETISRMAGSQHGSRKSVDDLEDLVRAAGRTPRQRTTTYGGVPAERHAAARVRSPAARLTRASLGSAAAAPGRATLRRSRVTVEPPLSRRIEELARFDEPEPDAAGLGGSVSALRAEVSAVRSELGSMRSELGAVRTDLDSLGGRLTGSVAASRTETGTLVRRVAEMAGRFDALGGRLDEVRADMPSIAREVREGLELLPVRTGTQLDDVVGRVTDRVGLRVDQMAADVRRTVTSALESDARTAAGTQAALVDARGALESRMAVLEDGLENVAERLEAFARDGAHTTKELLGELLGHVRRLDARVEQLGSEQVESVVARLSDVGGLPHRRGDRAARGRPGAADRRPARRAARGAVPQRRRRRAGARAGSTPSPTAPEAPWTPSAPRSSRAWAGCARRSPPRSPRSGRRPAPTSPPSGRA